MRVHRPLITIYHFEEANDTVDSEQSIFIKIQEYKSFLSVTVMRMYLYFEV